jgi:hypothetical protein
MRGGIQLEAVLLSSTFALFGTDQVWILTLGTADESVFRSTPSSSMLRPSWASWAQPAGLKPSPSASATA